MPLDPEKAAARSRRYEESPKGKAYIGGVTIIDVPSREEALRRDRDRGREAHVVRALADAFGNAGGKPEDLQALIVHRRNVGLDAATRWPGARVFRNDA